MPGETGQLTEEFFASDQGWPAGKSPIPCHGGGSFAGKIIQVNGVSPADFSHHLPGSESPCFHHLFDPLDLQNIQVEDKRKPMQP